MKHVSKLLVFLLCLGMTFSLSVSTVKAQPGHSPPDTGNFLMHTGIQASLL